ncbi:hypothetical protein DV738_g1776, partial [Chaetothyriales sp. CBS 135597]
MATATSRTLSELSPMAIRRNSPSFPQIKQHLTDASSPAAGSSPLSNGTNSPKLFWQRRDMVSPSRENMSPEEPSLVSAKRSSIENLKKASRVKNSGIFALEQEKNYDPSRPVILDGKPSGTNRGSGLRSLQPAARKENVAPVAACSPAPPSAPLSASSPAAPTEKENENPNPVVPLSPSKKMGSPKKSSLSKRSGGNFRNSTFDPDTGIWTDDHDDDKTLASDGRGLHTHSKSVTFDHGPPQINEYEMVTPDPSSVASDSREGSYDSLGDEDDYGFDRSYSLDIDDSFDASLEDADKTPVVMPEDWRFMSPELANKQLTQGEEDVFSNEYGSPGPEASPGAQSSRPHQTSLNSVDSNGQPRPLPPLPSSLQSSSSQGRSPNRDSLSGTLDRMSGASWHRPSPSVSPAFSKADIARLSHSSMSIEDRLRIFMGSQEKQEPKALLDANPGASVERASSKEPSPVRASQEPEDGNIGEPGPEVDEEALELEPHISRDSILRHMRSNHDLRTSASSDHSSYSSCASGYDPDIPIPSMEDPTVNRHILIKEEDTDEVDLYSIADAYNQPSDVESDAGHDQDGQSRQSAQPNWPLPSLEDGHDTPRARSPSAAQSEKASVAEGVSLPDFSDFGSTDRSFNTGLESYLTPPSHKELEKASPASHTDSVDLPDLAALRDSIQRPFTPQEHLEPPNRAWADEEPGTPESVIRHPITPEQSPTPPPELPEKDEEDDSLDASADEAVAHVQDELQTLSLDPTAEQMQTGEADNDQGQVEKGQIEAATKQQQRVSSLVQLEIPLAAIEEDLSFGLEKEFDRVVEVQKVEFERSLRDLYYPFHGRFPSIELPDSREMRTKDPMADVPYLPRPSQAPPRSAYHLPLGESFANRSPSRQRGYLMRQNTKVVVASERISYDEPRSPVGLSATADDQAAIPSAEPNQVVASPRNISQPTWVAEPWNGKSRRKSIRVNGEKGASKRKPVDGPVPPLPGQPSNVLGSVAEADAAEDEVEEFEDGVERGRLFVKVIGVKDLNLPLPKNEPTQFALTLDNGLHCVTTTWLDLAKSAPIGQEFELVVLSDLEFQLTLQMKLEEPPKVQRPASPTKAPPISPTKQNVFGRLFGSPKKKREVIHAIPSAPTLPSAPPSAYDLVQGLVGKDGAFARAYVTLSEHEQKAYGRPYSVDITCFNEWAMEEVNVGSSRSKKSVTQLRHRPPYPIGKLELLLLYVPKPKGAKDDEMPKSMNSAVRALQEAEERMQQQAQIKEFEGYLSQQGGDCPYWRRRYFKLVGTKLTAYHETTHQPRATINLAKASKLIDDKSILTQKETSAKGGGRRKSAFAEEEDGYMFVEEGFRIRFANGEVIDFYADSTLQKDEWMKALSQVVGKGIASSSSSSQVKPWVDMVLKRQKSMQARQQNNKPFRPEVPIRHSSREYQQQQQPVHQPPAHQNQHIQQQSHRPRPHSPLKQEQQHSSRVGNSGIPLPNRPPPGRPSGVGHMRSESYHPEGPSRSQASSPVKPRPSHAERARKVRSMIM